MCNAKLYTRGLGEPLHVQHQPHPPLDLLHRAGTEQANSLVEEALSRVRICETRSMTLVIPGVKGDRPERTE